MARRARGGVDSDDRRGGLRLVIGLRRIVHVAIAGVLGLARPGSSVMRAPRHARGRPVAASGGSAANPSAEQQVGDAGRGRAARATIHSRTGPSAGPGAIGVVHCDQERQRAVVRPRPDVADPPLEQLAVGGAARARDRRGGLEPGRLQRRSRLVEVVDRDRPRRSVHVPSGRGRARGWTPPTRPRSARRTPVQGRARARSRCRRGALPRARRARPAARHRAAASSRSSTATTRWSKRAASLTG